MLENTNNAMKANSKVREAYRLDDREDYSAFDNVSRRVFSMRLIRADMEVGQISRAGLQRRG